MIQHHILRARPKFVWRPHYAGIVLTQSEIDRMGRDPNEYLDAMLPIAPPLTAPELCAEGMRAEEAERWRAEIGGMLLFIFLVAIAVTGVVLSLI